MPRRRRNPSGVVEWCKAHPWMTFFIVTSALTVPVALVQAAAMSRSKLPPGDPSRRLPTAPIEIEPGRVFVPGVTDIA